MNNQAKNSSSSLFTTPNSFSAPISLSDFISKVNTCCASFSFSFYKNDIFFSFRDMLALIRFASSSSSSGICASKFSFPKNVFGMSKNAAYLSR